MIYGFLLYPNIGKESEINPYTGFRHQGIEANPPIAINCAGDSFTFSINQNLIATDGN